MAIVSSGQLTLTDLNDTKQLILYLNASVKTQVYDPNSGGVYTPNFTSSNLVITPELYVAGGGGANIMPSSATKSLTWYEGSQTTTALAETATTGTTTAGYTYSIPTGAVATTAKPLTIKSNLTANQMYTCVIVYTDAGTGFDITVKANIEIARIQNGTAGVNAITVAVTNDSASIPTDSAGGNAVYTGSGTEIHVYEGATELDYDGVGTASGKWNVTATPTNITVGAKTENGLFAVFADHSGILQDTAKIVFAISGKRADGSTFSVTKTQSFNKNKGGLAGTSPTLYRLIPTANAIQQNISNVYNPTTITAKGTSALGNATATDYGTRFIIAEADRATPTTYADKYSSSANEATTGKVYTPSNTTVASIRIRMYIAGSGVPVHGTTQMLDEQTIPVVKDGATGGVGADAYYINVWTPNGDTIRNGAGSLDIKADMYKGAGTVAPTAFKWYQQDPTATVASGGDADGLAGWRLINAVVDATTAPTLALQANTANRLTAQAYFVRYTWVGLSGETLSSAEATLTVTANNDLKVTIPAFATNAVMAKVYVGTVTGTANLHYQGEITTSAGSLVVSTYDVGGAVIPATSTASTAGVTSATITIVNNAIVGVEGFKCVATAPTTGIKYSGVAVVKDFQDPVSVNILGANILKNGQGSVILQAQLIQAGSEISTAGYKFDWTLYNANGGLNKILATGAGDTITVNATDFSGTNNLVCDVSK